MSNQKIAIIVIGYNRIGSLKRILNRLNECRYPNHNVDLYISLDKSDVTRVVECADDFEWKYGKKHVIARPERMGLKRHVLSCGNIINEYGLDALIVMEDDVYPADDFYTYAAAAVDHYAGDPRIAGVSLYSTKYNYLANYPFAPIDNGTDTYFMQFAQSWGQIWLKDTWNEFAHWMEEHGEDNIEADDFPAVVSGWSVKSWLKYHIKFCVETDKYFVYPYKSFSTCFADEGEHYKDTANKVPFTQVSLATISPDYKFVFSDLSKDNTAIYNVFFENQYIRASLREKYGDDVCVDLYGMRNNVTDRYWLTTQQLDFVCVAEYGCFLRPHDANIINGVDGKDVFLYDTSKPEVSKKKANWKYRQFVYYKSSDGKLKMMSQYIINSLKNHFKRG